MATKKPATKSAGAAAAKKPAPAKKSTAAAATKKAAPKTAVKAAEKPAAKPAAAKTSPAPAKRTPNAAFMKPVTASADLAAIIGKTPMPRTEVTKKIWDYIKSHKLQDKDNRRMINADAKLKKVFGGKEQVSMFEMTKLVSAKLK